jgi:regulation of enolase protein 1 (concanavalin A-like superfamily)
MRTGVCLMILVGSATGEAGALTGNELMLLRMTLRQEMTAQVQAAADSGDASTGKRVAPLETALLGIPRVQDLYATMTDNRQDIATRFNAARALAYFGDRRSAELLSAVLQGQMRPFAQGAERSQAALCLLYLGHDFPDSFAFSTLAPPLYPELDTLLDEPNEPLSPLSPYTGEQLGTAIALYLASDYPVQVRGPLSILTVEQEALKAVLDNVAEHTRMSVMRVPFGSRMYEWEEFKDQILAGDLLYSFRSDDAAWQAQEGSEGYALIHEGQVRAVILTGTSQSQEAGRLAFDDFGGQFALGWTILNADPTHWSLFTVPGTLTITTEDGAFTGSRQDFRNLFLIHCPALPGQDFQITTCLVSFQPIALWNQAGLLLWNSSDDYLKLDYEYGEGPPRPGLWPQRMYTACREVGGSPSFTWYAAEQNPERIWLRLIKRGDFCELFTSTDGESFVPLTALAPEYGPADYRVFWGSAEVEYVGLFAKNGTNMGVPSVEASFDFFEVKALTPEGD